MYCEFKYSHNFCIGGFNKRSDHEQKIYLFTLQLAVVNNIFTRNKRTTLFVQAFRGNLRPVAIIHQNNTHQQSVVKMTVSPLKVGEGAPVTFSQ